MCAPLRASLALVVACGALLPYTRLTHNNSRSGNPLVRDASVPIEFYVQNIAAPGLMNREGRESISSASDPLAAIEAALAAWDRPDVSTLRFAPLKMTDRSVDPNDGMNVIVFEDSDIVRGMTQGALAVTRLTFDREGMVSDSDIVFNPSIFVDSFQVPLSTELERNTYDLQALLMHHIGRALGVGPSGVISAAMYEFRDVQNTFRRYLSPDELAFLTDTYPPDGLHEQMGFIAGTITEQGRGPVTGALVTAVEATRGYIQTTLTDLEDGTFRMRLPASSSRYFVYVEPMDGGFIPRQIQRLKLDSFNTLFRPRFRGTNDAPRRVPVLPGIERQADITVLSGRNLLIIEQIGVDRPGGSGPPAVLTTGPIRMAGGRAHDLILIGLGIDSTLGIDGIRLLAPGIRIRPGTVRIDPDFTFEGGPVLRATVDVEQRTDRHYGTIAVVKAQASDVFTGALVLEPGLPEFSAAGIGNAASFAAECVAPGEIVSIFGLGLGPVEQVVNSGFDPETGLLPTQLGGVVVTFDGIAASMFFAIAGQLNLQVPYEIDGQESTVVVVRFGEFVSEAVTVPVVAAKPGLFASDGMQAIAFNQDGSLNGLGSEAMQGDVMTFFGTGPGVVAPAIASGAPAASDPLSLIGDVRVRIGGVEVPAQNILFAGMTPGFAGLFQINLQLPPGLPDGEAVEVIVTIRGVSSEPVTIVLRA